MEVVISRIEALECAVDMALNQDSRADWSKCGGESIRSIGTEFRAAWFTSGEERRATWIRFQAVIGRVKESQQQAKRRHQVFQVRAQDSRRVAEQIVGFARSAWPHEDGFIEFIGTITGAKLLAEVFVGIIEFSVRVMSFGLLKADAGDDRFAFLQQCSRSLKQAWESYHEHRDAFIGVDRTAIRKVLLRVQSELNEEWAKFKLERSGAEADRSKSEKGVRLTAEIGSLPLLGRTAGEKSRELESLWKSIGYVGDKEVENELWEEFLIR